MTFFDPVDLPTVGASQKFQDLARPTRKEQHCPPVSAYANGQLLLADLKMLQSSSSRHDRRFDIEDFQFQRTRSLSSRSLDSDTCLLHSSSNALSRRVGPPVPIHKYDIFARLIQLIIALLLMGGMSFIICVVGCVLVNSAYVTFRSDGAKMPTSVALTFFSIYLLKMLRSWIRTFIRMCILVFSEKFGADEQDFFLVRWVDHCGHYLALKFFPHSKANETILSFIKILVLTLIISGVVGVPLIYTSLFGYWVVVSVFCSIITLASAVLIVLVNLISRFLRAMRFFYSLSAISDPSRIWTSYFASTGNDHGKNVMNVYANHCLVVLLVLLALSFVSMSPGGVVNAVLLFCLLALLALVALFRIRRQLCCCCYVKKRGSVVLFDYDPNASLRRQIWIIFVVRSVGIFFGFVSLVLLDLSTVRSLDGLPPVKRELHELDSVKFITWVVAFYVFSVLKDMSFLFPVPQLKMLTPFLLFIFQCCLFFVAAYGNIRFEGFAFRAAAIFAIVEFNFRESKSHWTVKELFQQKKLPKHRRAMKNTALILALIGIFVFTSILVGINVGSTKAVDSNKVSIPTTNHFEPMEAVPPICFLKYTEDNLTMLQLARLSEFVYEMKPEIIETLLRNDTELSHWRLGEYALDSTNNKDDNRANSTRTLKMITGVRFAEFVNNATGVSVVAIRGTEKLDDVFQDLYLWSSVAFLQYSSYFGTFVNLWPIDVVAEVASYITQFTSYSNLIYWREMEDIVAGIIKKKKQSRPLRFSGIGTGGPEVLMTGHSLGGGLSSIIASHLKIPAVVFSAPGLGYSLKNYKLEKEDVMRYTVNVIPLYDPVAMFDRQIGMVQYINCKAGQPLECHRMDLTIGTLTNMCKKMK